MWVGWGGNKDEEGARRGEARQFGWAAMAAAFPSFLPQFTRSPQLCKRALASGVGAVEPGRLVALAARPRRRGRRGFRRVGHPPAASASPREAGEERSGFGVAPGTGVGRGGASWRARGGERRARCVAAPRGVSTALALEERSALPLSSTHADTPTDTRTLAENQALGCHTHTHTTPFNHPSSTRPPPRARAPRPRARRPHGRGLPPVRPR